VGRGCQFIFQKFAVRYQVYREEVIIKKEKWEGFSEAQDPAEKRGKTLEIYCRLVEPFVYVHVGARGGKRLLVQIKVGRGHLKRKNAPGRILEDLFCRRKSQNGLFV